MSRSSLFKAAGLIAVVTVLSKFLGLLRDQFIAHAYGASMVSDAYLYAFQIPSFALILLGGLGGPFHTATIAVLSRLIPAEHAPTETAQKLVNNFITLTGVVFLLFSVLAFFAAKPLIAIIAADASEQLKTVATLHLRWMSPMILIGGVIGIFYGISNLYKQYFWPSISPSAINLTLILWLWVLGPDDLGLSLAISTTIGAILQLMVQLPEFYKIGFRYFPSWSFKAEGLETVSKMLFPATIGTTIGQLNVYVAMFFASQLAEGSWTAFVLGNRLIQLPIGVLTIGMLVPLFPRFNQWVAEEKPDALRDDIHVGVLSMWLFALPLVVITVLLAEPGIRLLFERGAFVHHDTVLVSSVLVVLAFSVLPYMLRDAVTRVFYAYHDSKTPLIAGMASIALNALLNALLVSWLDITGIAISTVAVTMSNAIILMWLVRRHTKELAFTALFSKSIMMVLSSLICYGAGFGVQSLLPQAQTIWMLVIQILLVMLAVFVSYCLFLLLLKEPLALRFAHKVVSHPKFPFRKVNGLG